MDSIVGKWQQPEGQPFAGLWFEFMPDGSFSAFYPAMAVQSSGTYTAGDGLIDMDQTRHTFGLLGKFTGRYEITGDTLVMNLADPAAPRPDGLEGKNRRIYQRVA